MKYAVGVDLGGTNIVTILMNERGKIIARDKRPTEAFKGKNYVLKRIAEGIETVLKCQVSHPTKLAGTASVKYQVSSIQHQNLRSTFDVRLSPRLGFVETCGGRSTDIVGIGIGTPGLVDLDRGIVYEAPNIPGWDNVPLAKIYREKFGVPVFLENDANSAALGEWWTGAGKGTKHMLCFTLGTGIGGGIIIDGKVYHGAEGYAAELGHISLSFDGPKCGCGNTGCMEAYASAKGITERTRALLKDKKNRKSLIYKLINGNSGKITPAVITQAARKKDSLAVKIWKDTGYYLGSGIASYANIFNPEIIVLTGGMTGAGKLLFKSMWETVHRRAFKGAVKNLKIVKGNLPDDAGAVGAAKTAFQRTIE